MWDVIEWKKDGISVQRKKDGLIDGASIISRKNQSPTSYCKQTNQQKNPGFSWSIN